jgi:hypothetical protein
MRGDIQDGDFDRRFGSEYLAYESRELGSFGSEDPKAVLELPALHGPNIHVYV